jgi:UDP-glucose 4-epimerase
MRVVVFGATGNVGTSVLRALESDPAVHEIVGVARREPMERGPSKVAWRRADIARDPLDEIVEHADAVIHLAWLIQPARDESVTRAVNVEGSSRVFAAVARERVPGLIYASSVGAYSPGPKDRAVDESWPTDGTRTSFYARQKAEVERELDVFEGANPRIRVARLRPGLTFKREAASQIRRYFAGPLLPSRLVRREYVPVVPAIDDLRFQAVHTNDVATAYRAALERDVRGAFNIAADPVLDPGELAKALDARPVPVPAAVIRALAAATWRLRLQPTPPGWLDMALSVPIMDTSRARDELDWEARHSSVDALLELIDGLHERDGAPTPPLAPETAVGAR